jgi:hypothetical protein
MESFSVETTLTLADWQAFLRACMRKQDVQRNPWVQLSSLVAGIAFVAGAMAVSRALHWSLHLGSLIAGIIFGVAVIWLSIARARKKVTPEADGMVLGPRRLRFDQDGIRIERPQWNTFFDWSCCKEVELAPEHIFIWSERISAQILPTRDLPPDMTAEQAVTRIRALAERAATLPSRGESTALSHAGPVVDTGRLADPRPGTEARPQAPPLSPTRRANPLMRAVRFLLLRPQKTPFNPLPDWVIGGFAVGSLLLWLALDRFRYSSNAEFTPYDAPALTWYVVFGLLVTWLASRMVQPQVAFRSILFLFVVLAPVLVTCTLLLDDKVPAALHTAAAFGVATYVIVYVASGLRQLTGLPQVRATAAIVVLTLPFIAFNSEAYIHPTLWMEPDPETEKTAKDAPRWEQTEELLFSQSSRIDAQVGQVATPSADVSKVGVYFLGFAGVGSQKVFAEEIKLAAKRIGDRYGSTNRTVLLMNDRRDLNSYPLATSAGLKLALKGMAGRMNPDRDVLFLALSSHGSAEPALSVSNGLLPLRHLTGATLASALKESGIKWKVIVISACHAGAFIDGLRDDNTIVLTAAAGDRTSFGCSDDRELTYFGEAFYRDALPRSASLREAFDRAKADIASREQREGIDASRPQAFFGAAMDKKLAALEGRN